jgi:hypothetical protein
MIWRSVLVVAGVMFALALSAALLAGPAGSPETGRDAGDGAASADAGGDDATAHRADAGTDSGGAGGEATALPQMVGMSLNVYHAKSMKRYHRAIDRVADLGLNTLQVVTPVFQKHGASKRVSVMVGPGRGPTAQQLIDLLQHAEERGLTTILMPQVNFTEPRGNEWRGQISPPDWGPWWASYKKIIKRYLAIATLSDVDVFTVGCELLTTLAPQQNHEQHWHEIIRHCRAQFDGKLTFSTTWDTYQRVSFWDKLDYIGVSGYWDLTAYATDASSPSRPAINRRWRAIQKKLFAFSKKHDTPLLITELGYPSLPWALKDPWNYVNTENVGPDHAAQARGYRAFLRNWAGYITPPGQPPQRTPDNGAPAVGGAVFYEWDVYAKPPAKDTGMGIKGKPAYDVLARWIKHGRQALDDTDEH